MLYDNAQLAADRNSCYGNGIRFSAAWLSIPVENSGVEFIQGISASKDINYSFFIFSFSFKDRCFRV